MATLPNAVKVRAADGRAWLIEKCGVCLLLTVASLVLGLAVTSMSLFTAAWQFYAAGSIINITITFLLYLSFPTLVNR